MSMARPGYHGQASCRDRHVIDPRRGQNPTEAACLKVGVGVSPRRRAEGPLAGGGQSGGLGSVTDALWPFCTRGQGWAGAVAENF